MTIDVSTIAVLAVAAVACVCDLRTRRIPNVLTFGAAAAALGFSLAQAGISGLGWTTAAWLIAVALFFPFFLLGGMGAGDVKLLAALGAWLGVIGTLYLAFYTALAGGAMAIVVSLFSGYLRAAARNLWSLLAFWFHMGLRPHPELTLDTGRGPKLAYALPIACGAVMTLWLR